MPGWPSPVPASVHLIGIGGVAMSALAELLRGLGADVRGSDRAIYPPVSDILAASGIPVATPFAAANLDARPGVPAPELVVVGNAISRGNVELEHALERGLPLASLPEVIARLLVPGRRVTAVAGTHGKTTTTSIVAYLHHAAGRDPSFLVGGRPGNFDSGGRLGQGEDLVLEADEYDTAFFDKNPKFMHYWPTVGILGPVEFDHADIYADLAAVERAFTWFARLVPPHGTLVVHADDEAARRLAQEARCRIVTTGLDAPSAARDGAVAADRAVGGGGGPVGAAVAALVLDVAGADRRDDAEGQSFTVLRAGRKVAEARLALPGEHNARNALAALAACEAAGLPLEQAAPLLAGFVPPRRRLEPIAEKDGARVYDDFAHHPTAIAHTLATVRGLVPAGGRLIAALEPRSNTMVRALVRRRLEEALAAADAVLIGEVDRPDRFRDDERLDVAGVVQALLRLGVEAEGPLAPAAIGDRLLAMLRPGDRVVLMSNGGFGGLPARLARELGGAAPPPGEGE